MTSTVQQRHTDGEGLITSICPYTGAPIHTSPEWTDVIFGNDYSLSISIIADSILVVKIKGFSTREVVAESTDFTKQVIARIFGDEKEFFYIVDSTGITGITNEARKYYANYLKSLNHLKAFILCSSSPFMKLALNLSKRLNATMFRVEMVKDYEAAVTQAVRMAKQEAGDAGNGKLHGGFPPPRMQGPSPATESWSPKSLRRAIAPFLKRTPQPPMPQPRLIQDGWNFECNGFSGRIEIINGDIIHKQFRGYITESHMQHTYAMQRRFIPTTDFEDSPYYFVNGVEEIQGMSLKARKEYANLFHKWLEDFPHLRLVVIYGANIMLRTGLSISTYTRSLSIVFADDFNEAMSLVEKHKKKKRILPRRNMKNKRRRAKTVGHYADELNCFLGDINWEKEGPPDIVPEKPDDHPFKTVYDAIALIKTDIDELFREREMARKQIHELTQELIKAQENERRRIARDLHDNVAQDLASLIISNDTLFETWKNIPPEVRERNSAFTEVLKNSIASIRDLVYDLSPPGLTQMSIVKTIDQYCRDFSKKTAIEIDLYTAGLEHICLDEDTKINLFRILQEALNNVNKHARARLVTVRFIASHPSLILRIEDDGCGFEPKIRMVTALQEKRMGLISMEERVNLLNGELTLRSRPGSGTRVVVKFPYQRPLPKVENGPLAEPFPSSKE